MKKQSTFLYLLPSTICALGLMTCISNAQLPGTLSDGLVGYWSLNGNTTDSSSFNNTGTGYDLVLTNDRFGSPSSAYYFNGVSSYIDLGNQPQYNFGTNNFTLSAWVLSGSKQIDFTTYIIGKYIAPDPSSYGLGTAVTGPEVYGYSFFKDNNSAGTTSVSSQSIQDSQWHSVITTYDRSGNLSIYIDGVLGGATDISTLQGGQSNGTFLMIGGINSNSVFGPQLFEGGISDVGLWNKALTATEVTDLYNAQVIPEPSTYALLLLSGAASLWALKRRKS